MVHKKFVKKGGKIFGPYYYETYRENGKVKTVYVGKISLQLDGNPVRCHGFLDQFGRIGLNNAGRHGEFDVY